VVFFWKLLLAHLLADFPLQPYALVRRKSNPIALLSHLLIQLVVMMILLWPLTLIKLAVLLGIVGFHGLLDRLKVRSTRRLGLSDVSAYFIDQALHVLSLVGAAWILTALTRTPFAGNAAPWVLQALALVFATYVWGITERILAESNPVWSAEVHAQFWPRMILRAAPILALIAISTQKAPAVAGSLWPYLGRRYWKRALLADVLVSIGAILFLRAMG
jgi:hypothetical protein